MSEKKECPLFKECYGSCFGTMIEYCLSKNSKKYEDCRMYQEYLAKKVGIKIE